MPVTEEPVRGRYAYLEHPWLLGLSGLDQFRPFLRRQVPLPPLYHLSGLVVSDAALGMATFTMPASGWWQSGAGVFFGGTLAFVADAALGGAVYTSLPSGMALATSELSMNLLRPATVESGTINARARLIQAGRGQGLSEAIVEDAHGRLLAHATSRCIIQRLPFEPMEPPGSIPPIEAPRYDGPDPYRRAVEGEVLPAEQWNTRSGLELCDDWHRARIPPPPISHLVGWRGLECHEGKVVWAMPASEWFCTSYRTFYGGVIALLADGVMGGAVNTTLPPGGSYGTLDLKVNFLRPVQPDGRDLLATGTVVHRGRTVAVASADIDDADGRRVAIASSSHMIFEGRPWIRDRHEATLDEAPHDPGA